MFDSPRMDHSVAVLIGRGTLPKATRYLRHPAPPPPGLQQVDVHAAEDVGVRLAQAGGGEIHKDAVAGLLRGGPEQAVQRGDLLRAGPQRNGEGGGTGSQSNTKRKVKKTGPNLPLRS